MDTTAATLFMLGLMLSAAILSAAILWLGGDTARTWVRRVFLVLLNIVPFGLGTWRDEFSKREAFLACWLLIFIATAIALPIVASKFGLLK